MALVITRKTDETLLIGKDIVVKVVRVRGNRVRLLVEAPKDIPIVRGELTEPPQEKAA